ncbi:methyltransferase [Streptomyces sp. CBMA123]|uniref:methyltransferase n=1 Tax=Streptomyces sp. CBMA123 TaxID=1896313 RepID=UPI0016621C0C|nr:methyltransferase [Streptomyces sp. CBMA123]MBD0692931.1 methyltransferase [Streptomyces sp. CBMA123]
MTATPPDDTARLRATADFVREHDTADLFPLLLPGLDGPERRALAERCRFSHAALLLLPPDAATLHAQLAACGLDFDAPPQPSVVVRGRLARRHGRTEADLDVSILRPPVPGPGGERTVEVFALTVPPGSDLADLAAHERAHDHEAHLAFEVTDPDPLALRGLCALLARHGATPDGGGHNPHEDSTVLYFTAPTGARTGYRRVELHAHGDHRAVLADHLGQDPAQHSAETLLQQLTGAWTTQALAVSARIGLPDALDTRTGTTAADLAATLDAHPQSLTTLLRYLTMLGIVAEDQDGYRLTGTGALLRADAPGSMRPLALMYGGPFYRSFAELEHTVRTGGAAFDHLFGENHFDHFARDPELAELFDQSMAASSRMFDPLPAHPVITAAAGTAGTVVDIAGGNGELLGRLLSAHPGLHGTLLERPHAVEAARRRLDAAGLGGRCGYVPGDFADVPGTADVYLLSRVLHDWDDERCAEILRHCARAMPAHADLLIVERLLPDDGSASLATAWDVHMMCNTGGRERRADHYARLLADAGLHLLGHSPLPLGAAVLHARRAAVPAPGAPAHPAPAHSGR